MTKLKLQLPKNKSHIVLKPNGNYTRDNVLEHFIALQRNGFWWGDANEFSGYTEGDDIPLGDILRRAAAAFQQCEPDFGYIIISGGGELGMAALENITSADTIYVQSVDRVLAYADYEIASRGLANCIASMSQHGCLTIGDKSFTPTDTDKIKKWIYRIFDTKIKTAHGMLSVDESDGSLFLDCSEDSIALDDLPCLYNMFVETESTAS